MKKTLFILLIPAFLFSQDIPKNANTIYIKGVTFEQVVTALLDSGFKVDKMDKEFKTAKTEYRKFCADYLPELLLDIRVKDSTAIISGSWRTNSGLSMHGTRSQGNNDRFYTYPIQNEKMRIAKSAFEILNNFAVGLKGSVTYATL